MASAARRKKDAGQTATFKVPEAACFARVGPAAIYRGVKDGTIPHIRFGRTIVIPKAAFVRWLESCGEAHWKPARRTQ